MLLLEIGSIPEGVSHVDLCDDASDWPVSLDGGRLVGDVRVALDITRRGQDLYLKGKAGVHAVLECGRCLKEYEADLSAAIETWVIVKRAGETPEPENRENIVEVESGARYADLTENVRSEILLQIPFKRVCRPDCRGLCPICGTDLNTGRCDCAAETHDSRWDALKDIKKKR